MIPMNKPFPHAENLLEMIQSEVELSLAEFDLQDLKHRYTQNQQKIGASKYRKLLPTSAYLAAGGGKIEETVTICGAFELIIYSLKIFDDLQDGDNEDGIWNAGLSNAQRMNNAFILLNLAMFLLSNMDVSDATLRDMIAMITSTLVLAGIAQVDETYHERQLSYAENVYSKSSLFYGFIVACGALLASSDERLVFALKEIGEKIGTIYQLADDFVDEQEVAELEPQLHQHPAPLVAGWKEKIPNTILLLRQDIEAILKLKLPPDRHAFITFYLR